jgi:hypothetical protein
MYTIPQEIKYLHYLQMKYLVHKYMKNTLSCHKIFPFKVVGISNLICLTI